jgi:hypothetical protein
MNDPTLACTGCTNGIDERSDICGYKVLARLSYGELSAYSTSNSSGVYCVA